MRKNYLYLTYDNLTENLSPVFFASNDRMAKTMFLDSLKKNDLLDRLDDFTLYCLGFFEIPSNFLEIGSLAYSEVISLKDEATNEIKSKCSKK